MAQFFFRALPVITAQDATLDFEQLTFAFNNGVVEVNEKGELKLRKPLLAPEAQVERAINTTFEPSVTKDALVLLQINSKLAEVETTVSLKVGGVSIAAVVFPKLAEGSVQTVTIPVPAGKKWEAKVTAGAIGLLNSSYTFID